MSDLRYPPFRFSVPDRDTGELRDVEFNYSRLTSENAYQWERQGYYVRSVLNQWLSLLRYVTEKDSESQAYVVKRGLNDPNAGK